MNRAQKREAVSRLARQAIRDGRIDLPVGLGDSVIKEIYRIRKQRPPINGIEWEEVRGVTEKMIIAKARKKYWIAKLFIFPIIKAKILWKRIKNRNSQK